VLAANLVICAAHDADGESTNAAVAGARSEHLKRIADADLGPHREQDLDRLLDLARVVP